MRLANFLVPLVVTNIFVLNHVVLLPQNQISRIEAGVFTPLSKSTLQVLSLKLNKLTEIKPGDFEGLEKLKNLVVDDNLIQV